MYLLDTNTLIYFFKGQGRVAERLLSMAPSAIGVPAPVLYELEYGIARSTQAEKRRAQLDQFLRSTLLIVFDEAAARAAGVTRAALESKGLPIGPQDILIAGIALAQDAILVTHNTREFARIPGLRLEDWYD